MIWTLCLCLLALPAAAKDAEVAALARATLTELQPLSIREGREYCGLIGRNDKGRLALSPIVAGGVYACQPNHGGLREAIASFHTHGAHTGDADGEVPSLQDLLSDVSAGTDGYVSTPGGRLWFVDGTRSQAHQVCGRGCLPHDPRFQPKLFGTVKKSYGRKGLARRLAP